MPFEYGWRHVASVQGERASDEKLDTLRTLLSYANLKKRCSVCSANYDNHKMRYKVWHCGSTTCEEHPTTCTYWLKVLQCCRTNVYEFYEDGRHATPVGSPHPRPFTRVMKYEARKMAENSVTPNRILNELIDMFSLNQHNVPELRRIQNFVYNYRKSALNYSDVLEDIIVLAKDAQYGENLDESTPFTFGYKLNAEGEPVLGDGTDEDPFVLAFSTKAMIRQLDRDPETFLFHMDATFKLNTVEYPLFVCGISDASRCFFPVALFMVSQRTEIQYSAALTAISNQFTLVTGRSLVIRYFMADAEDAQFNGFDTVLASNMDAIYLMCWFHVMKKAREKLKDLSEQATHLGFKHLYQMHYARDLAEYESFKGTALLKWGECEALDDFVAYFSEGWITSRYCNWQCFRSPSGFSKTNNPAETFNKLIKRDYTLKVRMKAGELVAKVLLLCKHQSVRAGVFSSEPKPKEKDVARAKKLFDTPHVVVTETRYDIRFLLGELPSADDILIVRSYKSPEDRADALDKGEVNKRRMERLGQPPQGWIVNVSRRSCPCRAYFKYRFCIHLLVSMKTRKIKIPGWKDPPRLLANRRIRRNTGGTEATPGSQGASTVVVRRGSARARALRGRGSRGGRGGNRGGSSIRNSGRGRSANSSPAPTTTDTTRRRGGRPRIVGHALQRD